MPDQFQHKPPTSTVSLGVIDQHLEAKADELVKDTAAVMADMLKEHQPATRIDILSRLEIDEDINKVLKESENPFFKPDPNSPLDVIFQRYRAELAEYRAELRTNISRDKRRQVEKKTRGLLHRWRLEIKKQRAMRAEKTDRLKRWELACVDVREWLDRPMVLQRLERSLFQDMRGAPHAGDLFVSSQQLGDELAPDAFESMWCDCETFVVEHDWARAFNGATGIDEGDVQLPYEVCAFEALLSGRHVIATVFAGENDELMLLPVIRAKNETWVALGTACVKPNGMIGFCREGETMSAYVQVETPTFVNWHSVHDGSKLASQDQVIWLIYQQIRCVLIALSAEVAKKEVVRLPYRSNQPRAPAVRLPTYSYHVVSLARRDRPDVLPRDPNADQGTRKRLHFRRAHDRHYPNHITRIPWTLVGDPNLGWVDKHYKL